jgi:Clathrin adaptor complex small chain
VVALDAVRVRGYLHDCGEASAARSEQSFKAAFLLPQFKANKVVYRRYAGLFFAMCIDVTDNELAYLVSGHDQMPASCCRLSLKDDNS